MTRGPFLHRIFAEARQWLFLCAALSLLPAAAVAQTTQPDSQAKLFAVTETGSHGYSPTQVAALSRLEVGTVVDRSTIQTAADRLMRLGLFSAVRYHFSTDANGLTVIFELQDAQTFPISLDNFPWLTAADLPNIFTQAGIPLEQTAPASGTIDDRIAQALQKALEAKGLNATVTYAVTSLPGTDDRVVQFIAAGPDVRVADLQFSDPLTMRNPVVQAQLANIVGKPFSIIGIERFDFEQLRPVYLSHSYLRAKFSAPVVRLSSPNSVTVTVTVDPGPAYVWGGVAWNGNHAYTTSDLDALVKVAGLTSDQPVDGNKIFAMWQSIRTAYGHRGYIDATVEPKETFDDAAHRASYQVNISEGDQYHMGNLVLTGLSIDAEHRLRAAWHIAQGDVFDQTFCDYFLSRGIAEALKGLPAAQDTVGHYLQKNPQTKTVDVMIDFE
ncbi:MAG: POTRA domain-containing protein [Candidatus Acidiferrales bacterium]